MAWLKDPAWQQGLALLLVVAGAILIYRGVPSLGELDGVALLGVALFAVGVALPLISQNPPCAPGESGQVRGRVRRNDGPPTSGHLRLGCGRHHADPRPAGTADRGGWSTSSAGPVALAVAVVVATTLFETPLRTIAVASGKGVWDAIFILYIVWPALILYQVASGAGAFDPIRGGMLRLIPARLLVVLVFAWVLTSFIQAIAGFGAPLAVVSPMLLGLGVKPLYAVLLPIIGGAWANSFGSLGAPWLALESVVDVPDASRTLRLGALLVWIPNLTGGLMIAWLYGRTWALRRGMPAILIISLLHGGLLMLLVPMLLPIAMLLACAAGLSAALALSRWSFYRQEDDDEPDRIFTRDASDPLESEAQRDRSQRSRMTLPVAFAPYILLGTIAVVALTVAPVRSTLESLHLGLPFPETNTGFGVREEAVDAYAAFTPLTHPGTFLLLSALFGYVMFRRRGMYPDRASIGGVLGRAAKDALPVTTSVSALLLMSGVMSHSGEITVLALGLSAVAGSTVYLASANIIPILGSLITSSNTASNVLFGPLQATGAEAEGVPVTLTLGAQAAGAAVGNAIYPAEPCSAPRPSVTRLSSEASCAAPSHGPSRPACSSLSLPSHCRCISTKEPDP